MAAAVLENYAKKYIQTGSAKPLLHFMTTVGIGCYIGECVHHSRSEAASKRALKDQYEDAVKGYEAAQASKIAHQMEVEKMKSEIQQTYLKIEQLHQDVETQKAAVEATQNDYSKFDHSIALAKLHMESAKKKMEEELKH